MNKTPATVLALVPNWLGDAVMCTPALRVLKKRFPASRLVVAGLSGSAGVLHGLSCIDSVVLFPERLRGAELMRAGQVLRLHAPDLCVIFPHSFRAGVLAWMSGAAERLGYDRGGRSLFLTMRPKPYHEEGRVVPVYMAREYLDLVAQLGCEDDGEGLELAAAPEELRSVRSKLPTGRPIVGIAPGAAFGPSKRWMPEHFARVADMLRREQGAHCVLISGPHERQTRDAVNAAAEVALQTIDDDSPTLERLKAIVSCLDLLITNDSGPRHVAVAFKKPVICVMGPTSPRYTDSPWERGEVLRVEVDFGPCQKPVCVTDHRCMTGITPDTVLGAALAYLPGVPKTSVG